MNLLPGQAFELRSPLTRQAACEAMAAHVEPRNPYRIAVRIGFWTVVGNKGPDRFEGEATATGFSVQRLVGYFSFFTPRTDIAIAPMSNASLVTVRFRLEPVAYAIFLLPVLVIVFSGPPSLTSFASGALMLGVFYAVLAGSFWYESSHQKSVLRTIFRAS